MAITKNSSKKRSKDTASVSNSVSKKAKAGAKTKKLSKAQADLSQGESTKSAQKKEAPPPTLATDRGQTALQGASTFAGPDYQEKVAMAAYYIAEKKNFQPGLEWENWFEAEKQIQNNLR